MYTEIPASLKIHHTPKAEVRAGMKTGCWHLEIPAGPQGSYRLAQLDSYTARPRIAFPHQPPLTLNLRARVSDSQIPGTWGFGLWNDPFSFSLGFGGGTRRFPALPNAAWFFCASPQNHLSFRDDLPANGFVAQTFQASKTPSPLLALGALGFPLLLWSQLARRLRPIFRRVIRDDSCALNVNITQWHSYTLEWHRERVTFKVDNHTFETAVTPKAPLGLVIWIDNQYAAFRPDGKISYGTLASSQPAWLEIEGLSLQETTN